MGVTLWNGDCLKLMANIQNNSIDAIICDPPYGTTACPWDSTLDLDNMWYQLKRIIKPTGAIVLFGSQPFSTTLIHSNIEQFKYCWIWEKGRATGFLHAKNKPMKIHEDIMVFSDGTTVHANQSETRMMYNPQMSQGKSYKKRTSNNSGTLNHTPSKSNIEYDNIIRVNNGERYPTSVLKYSMHNVGNIHPTQKPVELMEYLVRTYTNENEKVLDFTMGSGTTGVACINSHRDFIGIELDSNYFELAKERIDNHLKPVKIGNNLTKFMK